VRALSASLLFALLLLCAGCADAQPDRAVVLGPAARSAHPTGSHVVVIVMENAEYGEVIGARAAPYVTTLAHRYGVATASFAMTHPSLPNYLALTSGSTHGISSDCTSCSVSGQNIVDQLERAGLSWRAYMEDLPRPCFTGAEAGEYAKKHDPFAYYSDIVRSPTRCGRIRGFAALASDLRAGRLPTFAWITPNLCNDGHDCGVAAGDRFLARTTPSLLSELGPNGLLLVTWDEGRSGAGCCGGAAGGRVATVVAGPRVRPGTREARPVDDYGVLGTIEEVLGLATLGGAADPRSGRLTSLFGSVPHIG
jgi:hypothetical protein